LDHVLPALKYSPNELLLGLPINLHDTDNPEEIRPPTNVDITVHLALIEQQRLDGYSTIVDHTAKRKAVFDVKLLKHAPREVMFKVGDLVQTHATQWVQTFAPIKKLTPMWSPPHHMVTRQCNSYTLETLDSNPIDGVFNARHLQVFTPRDGTKLAFNELVQENEPEDEDGELEVGWADGDTP
jgi:hypothetical protein